MHRLGAFVISPPIDGGNQDEWLITDSPRTLLSDGVRMCAVLPMPLWWFIMRRQLELLV